jgi:uncharacterized membrane protein YccC
MEFMLGLLAGIIIGVVGICIIGVSLANKQ